MPDAFFYACRDGQIAEVKRLLTDLRTDVNQPDDRGNTPFALACRNGHTEVVSLLLADPRIDANKSNNSSATPLFQACNNGHSEVVSLLLADPIINVKKTINDSLTTPFAIAYSKGHTKTITAFIEDFLLKNPSLLDASTQTIYEKFGDHCKKDPTNFAFENGNMRKEYKTAPENNGAWMRLEINPAQIINAKHKFAAAYFVFMISVIEDYLTVPNNNPKLVRFFNIVKRLPLELQMVLANRIANSGEDVILSNTSTPYFRIILQDLSAHLSHAITTLLRCDYSSFLSKASGHDIAKLDALKQCVADQRPLDEIIDTATKESPNLLVRLFNHFVGYNHEVEAIFQSLGKLNSIPHEAMQKQIDEIQALSERVKQKY
jgi:hypothetical protein